MGRGSRRTPVGTQAEFEAACMLDSMVAIGDSWVYSTVLICDRPLPEIPDSFGTGFLVTVDLEDGLQAGFVVTNKHVFADTLEQRQSRDSVHLYFQRKEADPEKPIDENVALVEYIDPLWREHPDPSVDVLALDVTGILVEDDTIRSLGLDYSNFAFNPRQSMISAGSHVYILGYPGVKDLTQSDRLVPMMEASTLRPIVKWGIAASNPSDVFADNSTRRTYRGFLVDGLTLPGMSGSPVFLAEDRYKLRSVAIDEGPPSEDPMERLANLDIDPRPRPPLLLGVVAETRFVGMPDNPWTHTYAGFGLAFNAETIRETIDLFDDVLDFESSS